VVKIAVTGPESSGKTTLTRQLAEYFHTGWCPEYSREYFQQRATDYTLADVVAINKGQMNAAQNLIAKMNTAGILFFDTEPIVNQVWAMKKFGFSPPEIQKSVSQPYYDLYLLCFPDLKWEYDPLREDEHQRMVLFDSYVYVLTMIKANFFIVKGYGKSRFTMALDRILSLFPSMNNIQ